MKNKNLLHPDCYDFREFMSWYCAALPYKYCESFNCIDCPARTLHSLNWALRVTFYERLKCK